MMTFNIDNSKKYVVNFVIMLVLHIGMMLFAPNYVRYESILGIVASALLITVLFYAFSNLIYILLNKFVCNVRSRGAMSLISIISLISPVIAMSWSISVVDSILSFEMSNTGYSLLLILFVLFRVRNNADIARKSFMSRNG